jgi:hypothetical protein
VTSTVGGGFIDFWEAMVRRELGADSTLLDERIDR